MLEPHESIIAGRYRLLGRLRRGGMSEVFLSLDEQTQQHVALKLVSNDTPDCFDRLKHEIRVLSMLSHKHIMPIMDHGEWENYAYLVMSHMKHGNLRSLLDQGPLSRERAGKILSQVASALQYAHEQGILHRDIKASNILLKSIEEDDIYLADFGLAKALGEGSDITQTGYLIGTPEYMAPELVTMAESVSSDIYALGILLYKMLTGRMPFTGTTPLAICWKHVYEVPPLPSSLNTDIDPAIEAIILRAIDKDPARRFPTVQNMAEAYEQALLLCRPSPVLSRPLAPAYVEASRLGQYPITSGAFPRERGFTRLSAFKRNSMLALVALLWLLTSFGLGFMVAHSGVQNIVASSIHAHSVGQAVHPVKVDPPVKLTPPVRQVSSPPPTAATTHSPPPITLRKHHKHDDGGGGDN